MPPLPAIHDTLRSGSHDLHRIVVTPEQPAWAQLAVLHGYGDHAGRFVHFMQWMAERGVACHAIDFRGHGRSSGKRAHVNRWEEYLDDLEAFLDAEEATPIADLGFRIAELNATNEISNPKSQISNPKSPPLFVLGHSHGGLITAAAVIEGRLHCRGVILSSPYLDLKMPVPLHKRFLAAIGSQLMPSMAVKSGITGQLLSRDPQMIADTKADPHSLGIATPRWFKTATQAQAKVRSRAAEFTLPLLMLVAGDDTVANPQASMEFFDQAGAKDKTQKCYAGFKHELLREVDREKIFEDVLQWLRGRSSAHAVD